MKINLLIISIILFISPTFATIINVPVDIDSIQGGINMAINGDTVLVQPSTYVENINFSGKNIVVGSLTLTTGDTSYISNTVIDGDSSGSVVMFENGEDSTTVLSGFTITNGSGRPDDIASEGGGIYCDSANPRIENCKIINNFANQGGGIYCRFSNSRWRNVLVKDNSSYSDIAMTSGDGGGIYFENSNADWVNVEIVNNTAEHDGGGIFAGGSNIYSVNFKIYGNFADYNGGGISEGGEIYMREGEICGNSAEEGGGIISGESTTLEKVLVCNNIASSGKGGGIISGESTTLKKVLVCNNSASSFGGGIYSCGAEVRLINTTVCYNTGLVYGGGIYETDQGYSILVNTILWGNLPQEVFFNQTGAPNSIVIAYSDIKDSTNSIHTNNNGTIFWLDGNIAQDPLFVGGNPFDYNLTAGSPCVDAGTSYFIWLNEVLVDMDSTQYHSFAPDMGAYESPFVANLIETNTRLPVNFLFHQNYPNPFNPNTIILFDLPNFTKVKIDIFNLLGQKVETLLNKQMPAGSHEVEFIAKDLPSGVYLYRIEAGSFQQVRKMIILK
jgi:predicted outer membrane repeat protein